MENKQFDIISIGNALIDAFLAIQESNIYTRVDSKKHELCFQYGEKIHVDSCEFLLGGNACNVAVGFSRLGLKTSLSAEIGNDEFSQKILHLLSQEPLDTSLIIQTKGSPASFAIGINVGGERTLFVEHVKRAHNFSFDSLLTKWMYVTSLGIEWKHAYQNAVEYAKEHGVKLAFSPGTHQLEEGLESFFDVMEASEILIVNKEEAERISNFIHSASHSTVSLSTSSSLSSLGVEDLSSRPKGSGRIGSGQEFQISNQIMSDSNYKELKNVLRILQSMGPKIIVLTDGANGSFALGEKGQMYTLGVFPCKIVERTGAGDAYASGFLGAYILGKSIEEAMRWGAVNASSVIEKVGAQPGLLRKEEMEKKLEEFKEFQAKEI